MIKECELLNKEYKKPINNIYIGDLLSVVMGNIKEGSLWITTQRSMNVIAIANLNDVGTIIFPHLIKPDQDVIDKANECEISLYTSKLSAYELATILKESGY